MSRQPPPAKGAGEVLFELRRVGSSVRVAAIDAATGVEVVVVGPATACEEDLCRLARRKLDRALAATRQ